MLLLALINLRGVGESVKFNVVLTLVEVTALTIVIGVGFYAMSQGDADFGRVTTFENPEDKGMFLAITAATSIAFFAMVGFEDSVNMVEETQEPERIFPRTLLTGLGIAVIIYVLVAISVVAILTPDQIADAPDGGALLAVVQVGAPDFPIDRVFPFLAVFAVANTALINMLMASRLLYGLAHQDVLPRVLGQGLARTARAVRRHRVLDAAGLRADHLRRAHGREQRDDLAGVTSLLLLGVFTVVNVACLVLRRDGRDSMFRSPGLTPVDRGARLPVPDRAVGRPDGQIYQIAAASCCVIGVVLWAITWATNRGVRAKKTGFRDIEHLDE